MRWSPLLLVALLAAPAWATSERTVKWKADKIFPTAVRFLRIDEGVTITEKDADAGYVLFDLPDEGKMWHGALEVITVESDEKTVVKLVLRLEGRPDYMEIGILDRLEKKLRDELGKPPEPKPKPEPEPAPEAPAE
jgi:hypothetical protein